MSEVMEKNVTLIVQSLTKQVVNGRQKLQPVNSRTIEVNIQPMSRTVARKDYGITDNRLYKAFCDPDANVKTKDIVSYEGTLYRVIDDDSWPTHVYIVLQPYYEKK